MKEKLKILLYTINLDRYREYTGEELEGLFKETCNLSIATGATYYTLESETEYNYGEYEPVLIMRFYRIETDEEVKTRIKLLKSLKKKEEEDLQKRKQLKEEMEQKKQSPEYKEYLKLKNKLGL